LHNQKSCISVIGSKILSSANGTAFIEYYLNVEGGAEVFMHLERALVNADMILNEPQQLQLKRSHKVC